MSIHHSNNRSGSLHRAHRHLTRRRPPSAAIKSRPAAMLLLKSIRRHRLNDQCARLAKSSHRRGRLAALVVAEVVSPLISGVGNHYKVLRDKRDCDALKCECNSPCSTAGPNIGQLASFEWSQNDLRNIEGLQELVDDIAVSAAGEVLFADVLLLLNGMSPVRSLYNSELLASSWTAHLGDDPVHQDAPDAHTHLAPVLEAANATNTAVVTADHDHPTEGCGIVEYATREQAQNAVATLSNQNLMGRLVYVREDREAEPRFSNPSSSRMLGGLAFGQL